MGKTFVQGLVILVAGIVALALNQMLNLGLGSITFGLAIGGVLGLVSDGSMPGRMGGFIVGMIVAMVLFVVNVLLLNATFLGQVVSILIGFGLITVICALTGGRLPLWSGLLGAALITGSYQFAFLDNPAGILTELPQYATMALVPASLAFLAAVFVADQVATRTQIDEKFEELAGNAGVDPQSSETNATPANAGTAPPSAGPAGSNPNSEV